MFARVVHSSSGIGASSHLGGGVCGNKTEFEQGAFRVILEATHVIVGRASRVVVTHVVTRRVVVPVVEAALFLVGRGITSTRGRCKAAQKRWRFHFFLFQDEAKKKALVSKYSVYYNRRTEARARTNECSKILQQQQPMLDDKVPIRNFPYGIWWLTFGSNVVVRSSGQEPERVDETQVKLQRKCTS